MNNNKFNSRFEIFRHTEVCDERKEVVLSLKRFDGFERKQNNLKLMSRKMHLIGMRFEVCDDFRWKSLIELQFAGCLHRFFGGSFCFHRHNHDIFLIKNDNDEDFVITENENDFLADCFFIVSKNELFASISFHFMNSSSINDFSFASALPASREKKAFNSIYSFIMMPPKCLQLSISMKTDKTRVRGWRREETRVELIYSSQSLALISLTILFMFCHGKLHFEISLIVIASGKLEIFSTFLWKHFKFSSFSSST